MANWFEKILPSFIRKETTKKSTIPEGLWQSCDACNNILYVPELESNLFVCPKCDHHIRIGARKMESGIRVQESISPARTQRMADLRSPTSMIPLSPIIELNIFINEIGICLLC